MIIHVCMFQVEAALLTASWMRALAAGVQELRSKAREAGGLSVGNVYISAACHWSAS